MEPQKDPEAVLREIQAHENHLRSCALMGHTTSPTRWVECGYRYRLLTRLLRQIHGHDALLYELCLLWNSFYDPERADQCGKPWDCPSGTPSFRLLDHTGKFSAPTVAVQQWLNGANNCARPTPQEWMTTLKQEPIQFLEVHARPSAYRFSYILGAER